MGVFDRLFSDKIKNENRSKPWSQNQTAEEQKDWFKCTRPWHKVQTYVTDALIDRCGSDPMFELLVIRSIEWGLIPQIVEVGNSDIPRSTDVICGKISVIFSAIGEKAVKDCSKAIASENIRKLKKPYKVALDALETTLLLEPRQILAYGQLAALKHQMRNNEDALDWARKGLEQLEILKGEGFLEVTAQSEVLPNLTEDFAEMETRLQKLVKELEN
jgi:hypothetical protein